jgi:hypothetical protein
MGKYLKTGTIINGKATFLNEAGSVLKSKPAAHGAKFIQIDQDGDNWVAITDDGWRVVFNDNATEIGRKRIAG